MRRLVVAVAVVCGAVVLSAAPAFAHAAIQGTDPVQSSALPSGSPPRLVTLRFDEPVAVTGESVQVFDGAGKAVKVGAVVHGPNDTIVKASLPRVGDGTYVVTWRVVSADSHPVQGAFTFGVGRAAGTTANVQGLLASQAGNRGVGIAFGVDRAVAFLSLLVLVGGLAFVRWFWPDAAGHRDVRRLLFITLGAVVVTSLVGIALQAAYASGGGVSAMFDGSQIRPVMHTRFGQAWLVRAALALLFVPFLRPQGRDGRGAQLVWEGVFVVAAVIALGTFTYAGHGNTGRMVLLGNVTDLAHLGSAGLWLGGVAVLSVGLRDPEQPSGAARATTQFSKLALPAILVVTLSGTVQAWRQIETWSALWHTTYARLLIAKVLVITALLVAANASRDILRLRVVPALRTAFGPGAARREADPEDIRELRNGVWVEAALAIVIVAITAGLVNAQPAREAAAATPRTYNATLKTADVWFGVAIQPTLPGDNTVVVTPRLLKDPAGSVLQLDATLSLPGRVARIPMAFAPLERGRYVATVQVPFAGDWTLQIRALRTQIDESVAATTVRFG